MLTIAVDLGAGRGGCDESCTPFLDFWRRFWGEHADQAAPPVAILTCRGYLERLRPKSRAMVRQANRRYTFEPFDINGLAHEVQAINFSKRETSYGPTYGWYVQPVLPRRLPRLCAIHRDTWYGGFDRSLTLRGYLRLIRLNTLGVIHDIFSHAEGATGVQNGLIAYAAEHAGVEHISYHTMVAASHTGRPAFKARVGFEEARLTIREPVAV